MFDYGFWAAVLVDGVVSGFIYGLLGLCVIVIFRSNHLFNFCLTQLATLIILVLATLLEKKYALFPVLAAGLVGSFVIGVLLHFTVMRFITEKKNVHHHSQSLLTIGLLFILDGICNFKFTDEPMGFPSPFGDKLVDVFGLKVSYQSLGVIGVLWLTLLVIYLFFRFSKIGLKMEAVAENTTAARLRGIRASNILAFAWGLTTALSVLAGILIAPSSFVYPQMFSYIFSYSLIAIVIGGLESPLGAVVGGVLIGVVENIGSQIPFIGPDLKFVFVFLMLLLTLTLRPRGIWGRAEGRRV